MPRSICILLVALVLCGCQKPAGDASAVSASSLPQAPVSLVKSSENGMLTVDPAAVKACTGGQDAIAAKISWDASSVGTEGVQIWLQGPGEEKKLWSASGAIGQGETGPWLRKGSSITLVNGEDDKELARIMISAVPCS